MRDEFDEHGEASLRLVEEVFTDEAEIWHVHVGLEVVRTTSEHPFWVQGKGWVKTKDLVTGDLLVGHNGLTIPVGDILATGETERVYNLRIADHHTYFVGGDSWGYDVWVHNACVYQSADNTGKVFYVGVADRGLTKTHRARLRAATKLTGVPAVIIPGLSNVDKHVAEAIEFTLIKHHKRVQDGGSLLNKSRGTGFKKYNDSSGESSLAIGSEWLRKIGYPGF